MNGVSPLPMLSSTSLFRIAAGKRFVHPLFPEWPWLCGISTPIRLSRSAPPSSSEASGMSLVPKPSIGSTACWMTTVWSIWRYLLTQTMSAWYRSSPTARECGNANHRLVISPLFRCTTSRPWPRSGIIFYVLKSSPPCILLQLRRTR